MRVCNAGRWFHRLQLIKINSTPHELTKKAVKPGQRAMGQTQ
jgi:hypothetical protein